MDCLYAYGCRQDVVNMKWRQCSYFCADGGFGVWVWVWVLPIGRATAGASIKLWDFVLHRPTCCLFSYNFLSWRPTPTRCIASRFLSFPVCREGSSTSKVLLRSLLRQTTDDHTTLTWWRSDAAICSLDRTIARSCGSIYIRPFEANPSQGIVAVDEKYATD